MDASEGSGGEPPQPPKQLSSENESEAQEVFSVESPFDILFLAVLLSLYYSIFLSSRCQC